jgi:MinD superfamily P-loop ATPase
VCINKYDLNTENTAVIESMAADGGFPVVGKVPFDTEFTRAMVQAATLIEYDAKSATSGILRRVWSTILSSPAMSAGQRTAA